MPSALIQSTVGCVWNFQIGGGSIKAIFQSKKLKFDMVLYFGLINSPTVAKKFSCKNPKVRSPTELIMDPFEGGGVLRVRVV